MVRERVWLMARMDGGDGDFDIDRRGKGIGLS